MLAKAAGEAKALGLFAAIEDPELVPDLIAKADAQLRTLAAQIDDEEALPEELRGVETPEPAADDSADEADADESTDEEEADADDTDADDDDDSDGADGLGAMFG
jgi:large subunit ribosomal protein L10